MNIIETNLKFNSNHSTRKGSPPGIVLHHAVSNGSVEQIHKGHLNRGYAGIGYHFYVRKDGKVYRGRPEDWVGAHTVGHNTKIGICAEGNFENDKMSAAQQNAISEVIAYLFDKYGEMKVYKHRDLDATACPGKNYPFDAIVSGAKNGKPATEKATVSIELNVLRRGDDGEQVKTLQNLLIAKGYKLEEYGADGDFGGETEAAVKAFQHDHGLDDDGIVGVNTWTTLLCAR